MSCDIMKDCTSFRGWKLYTMEGRIYAFEGVLIECSKMQSPCRERLATWESKKKKIKTPKLTVNWKKNYLHILFEGFYNEKHRRMGKGREFVIEVADVMPSRIGQKFSVVKTWRCWACELGGTLDVARMNGCLTVKASRNTNEMTYWLGSTWSALAHSMEHTRRQKLCSLRWRISRK